MWTFILQGGGGGGRTTPPSQGRVQEFVQGGGGGVVYVFDILGLPPFRTVLECFKLTIQNVFIPFFKCKSLITQKKQLTNSTNTYV